MKPLPRTCLGGPSQQYVEGRPWCGKPATVHCVSVRPPFDPPVSPWHWYACDDPEHQEYRGEGVTVEPIADWFGRYDEASAGMAPLTAALFGEEYAHAPDCRDAWFTHWWLTCFEARHMIVRARDEVELPWRETGEPCMLCGLPVPLEHEAFYRCMKHSGQGWCFTAKANEEFLERRRARMVGP